MTKTKCKQRGGEYPKVNRVITILLFLYVFTHYIELGTRVDLLDKIRFELVLGVVLLSLSLLTGNIFRLWNNKPLLVSVLCFYALVAIQVPLSRDVDGSAAVFVNRFVKLSCMTIFIVAFVRSPLQLQIFLGGFLLACMKLGAEGFVGTITGDMMWENQGVMRLHGHGAVYGHPNSFSGMALGMIPFLYYYFPLFNWPVKLVIIVGCMFAMNIIVFTASRTGYIGLLGLISYLIFRGQHKMRIGVAIVVVFIIGVYVVPHNKYIQRFESIFSGKDIEGASIETRKEILRDAIYIFKSNPFGVGVGAFPAVRQEVFGRSQDTHNLYLEILTNIGIQGGIAFVCLIIFIYSSLRESEKRYNRLLERMIEFASRDMNKGVIVQTFDEHVMHLRFLKSTCQAVQLFLVVRLVLGLFGMDLYEIYWWFAIGLAMALGNIFPWAEKRTSLLLAV